MYELKNNWALCLCANLSDSICVCVRTVISLEALATHFLSFLINLSGIFCCCCCCSGSVIHRTNHQWNRNKASDKGGGYGTMERRHKWRNDTKKQERKRGQCPSFSASTDGPLPKRIAIQKLGHVSRRILCAHTKWIFVSHIFYKTIWFLLLPRLLFLLLLLLLVFILLVVVIVIFFFISFSFFCVCVRFSSRQIIFWH